MSMADLATTSDVQDMNQQCKHTCMCMNQKVEGGCILYYTQRHSRSKMCKQLQRSNLGFPISFCGHRRLLPTDKVL